MAPASMPAPIGAPRRPLVAILAAVAAAATLAWRPATAADPGGPIVLAPDADAYVRSTWPSTNYGLKGSLQVDASPEVLESYLRFTVPATAEAVASATLRLYATDGSGNGGTLYRVPDTAWAETAITWKSKPALGPAVTPIGTVPLSAWVELDVSAVVTGPGAYSFAITTPSTNGSDYVSKESATAELRPQLVVRWEGSDTVAPSDPVIAAAGDVACDPADPFYNGGEGAADACRTRATLELLRGIDPDAVLVVGDAQEAEGTLAQYTASYAPTWGEFLAVTHPVPGNHDYLTAGATGYFAYFGEAAGDPSRGWYSFDIGAWHVIALNSSCTDVGGCDAGSPQEQWLRADLAANPAACTLAYWHHPRFSSRFGVKDKTLPFWEALYEAGAELVLAGHAHVYERFGPQDPAGGADPAGGIRQIVVGTGGQRHHSFWTVLPNSEARDAVTFGVVELTLHPTGYDWRFVPEDGGSFTDAGSGSCH